MLPRAALRAIRPATLCSSTTTSHLRHASPIIPIALLKSRTYASKPPHKPSRPASSPPKPRQAPPPPQAFQATAKSPRQTSPGTSLPKDETWKPQDGIKFGGPTAATPTGQKPAEGAPAEMATGEMGGQSTKAATGAAAAVEDVHALPNESSKTAGQQRNATNVEEAASMRDTHGRQNPLQTHAQEEEPLVQKVGVDDPLPDSVRYETQQRQAEGENSPPPEAPTAEDVAAQQAQQPLPDLRQGIPSTFDFEFGKAQQRAANLSADEQARAQQQEEGLDLTREETEGQRQRDRGERDYDSSAYETSLDRRRATLANYLYASILFGTLTAGFYLSRPFSTSDQPPAALTETDRESWSPAAMWNRVKARTGDQMGYYTEPTFGKLLPEVPENQRQPLTLVLSLEDLMIHTTWTREHGYRTAKRPGIDYFIRYLSQYYELVLFTSVPIAMADPVIKKLDPYHFIMWPLGREATKYEGGEYVKDLAYLNRDLKKTLIVDTHAPHVRNQPENAIIIPKWSGDPKDAHVQDLVALIPFLEYVATMGTEDVRPVLKSFEGTQIPEEFARREGLAREKFLAQLERERGSRGHRSLGSLGSALGIKSSPAMGGGMVLADGQSVSEGLAQGKMLSDQIREQGQKQYEFLEKQIREHGAQWLKEEEEEQKKMMEAQMKDMKKSTFAWFGGGGSKE